jgi:phage replication O-like protein O
MIANEVLEALPRLQLNGYEWRVLLFIIRKTYGWHKKSDLIPLSQISAGTGLSRQNSWRALRSLTSKLIVVKLDYNRIGFNKNYAQWYSNLTTGGVVETDYSLYSKMSTSKEKKDNIRKEINKEKKKSFDDVVEEMRVKYPDLDIDEEIQKMIHHFSKKGARAVKDDKATLRNWCANAKKFKDRDNGANRCVCGLEFPNKEQLEGHKPRCRM